MLIAQGTSEEIPDIQLEQGQPYSLSIDLPIGLPDIVMDTLRNTIYAGLRAVGVNVSSVGTTSSSILISFYA